MSRFGSVSAFQSSRPQLLPNAGSASEDQINSASESLIGASARVTIDADQAIGDSADTPVTWSAVSSVISNSAVFDQTGATNSIRVLQDGVYAYTIFITFAVSAVGDRYTGINVPGVGLHGQYGAPAPSGTTRQSVSGSFVASAGDVIADEVRQGSGGPLDILTKAGDADCFMYVTYLGKA